MLELTLLALALLIYLPSMMAFPFWDDTMIFNNPLLTEGRLHRYWRKSWTSVRWPVLASVSLTFRLFQKVDEFRRPFYVVPALHLTNAVFHWLNSLLLWQIGLASGLDETKAAVAGLIFLVHPLAASAVAPMITRSSILSTACIFTSVVLVLDGVPSAGLIFAILAIWMKEDAIIAVPLWMVLTAFTAPWSLLWLAVVVIGFHRWIWYLVKERAPSLLLHNGDEGMGNAGLETSLPWSQYIPTALVENLWRWPFWVMGLHQNGDPMPTTRYFKSREFVISAGIIIGIIATVFFGGLPVKIALLLILMSPWFASWFFRLPDPVSEPRAYCTVGGIGLLGGFLLPASPLVIVPVIGVLSIMAMMRAWAQSDELKFWLIAWNGGSHKLKVAVNIGACWQRMGDIDNALKWHAIAQELSPENGLVMCNRGLAYEGKARLERKIVTDKLLLTGTINQKDIDERFPKANALLLEAVRLTQEGLKRCPNDPNVVNFANAVYNHASALGLTSVRSIA